MIRPAQLTDAQALVDIYNPFIRDTIITFEEEPISAQEMASRISKVTAAYPWLVWEEEGPNIPLLPGCLDPVYRRSR